MFKAIEAMMPEPKKELPLSRKICDVFMGFAMAVLFHAVIVVFG